MNRKHLCACGLMMVAGGLTWSASKPETPKAFEETAYLQLKHREAMTDIAASPDKVFDLVFIGETCWFLLERR